MQITKMRPRDLALFFILSLAACGFKDVQEQPGIPEAKPRETGGPLLLTPSRQPLQAVPFHRVQINDPFWSPRLKAARECTVTACLDQCEKTGRIQNFAVASGGPGSFRGRRYDDSDLYKVLEGAAYCLSLAPDPKLQERVDRIVDLIARAQHEDGYLDTYYSLVKPEERWRDIRSGHELYCAGHLIEAAIAYEQATGKKKLLAVAMRLADHIQKTFGPGRRQDPPGHQEIELALIKLARVTGIQRYDRLARFFLEQRGRPEGHELYGEYSQDHLPIRQQHQAVGHSVRAMYQSCAIADVALADGDQSLLEALELLWQDIAHGKIYLTGGIGATASNEGFTDRYFLPNDEAYAETCAAIALSMWNHRMYLLTRKARYADALERSLYNGLLSGISLAGDRFFYTNPLASRGEHQRSEWFACACCPSNLARFLPSVGGRIYAHDGDSIHVLLYVASQASIPLAAGEVEVSQLGSYPWDGEIRIFPRPEKSQDFALCLRLPDFALEKVRILVNGSPNAIVRSAGGFAVLRRRWTAGDEVTLKLPLEIRRVHDDPRVKSNAGRVALMRGPLVYCLEGVDHGGQVRNLALPAEAQLRERYDRDLLGGVVVVEGEGLALHRKDGKRQVQARRIRAIPYYAWNNRGPTEMVTWIPEATSAAEYPGEGPSLGVDGLRLWASHCSASDTVLALTDRLWPVGSNDHDIPRMTFWSHRGSKEWVALEFQKPRSVSQASVYWFDDEPRGGGCRRPQSWRLLYEEQGQWKPVSLAAGSKYATDKDRRIQVTFAEVRARRFRLELQLQKGFSAGILEWELR